MYIYVCVCVCALIKLFQICEILKNSTLMVLKGFFIGCNIHSKICLKFPVPSCANIYWSGNN